jgi:heat shock protein HslJ
MPFAVIAAAACAVMLAGCGPAPVGGGAADPALRGAWVLASARDGDGPLQIDPGSVTLTVADHAESTGKATCGAYTAALYGTAERLRIQTAASARADCQSPGASDVQSRYLIALDRVTHAIVSPGVLELSATGISLRFVSGPGSGFATIGSGVWQLTSVKNPLSVNRDFAAVPVGVTLTLDDASHFSVTTPCRELSGRYRLRGGEFLVLSRESRPLPCTDESRGLDTTVMSVLGNTFMVLSTHGSIQLINPVTGIALFFLSRAQYLDGH